jgi:hypothetical protein
VEAFASALEPVAPALIAALEADAGDDVAHLLDAMGAEAGGGAVSFGAVRTAERWDAALRAALGADAVRVIREPLERWFGAGPGTAAGPILGVLSAVTEPSRAIFTLTEVAGQDPEDLGFSTQSDAVWESPNGDRVALRTALALGTSAFVVGSARAPALAEVSGADSVAQALAALIPCDLVASTLVDHGQAVAEAYSGCDVTCALSLCEAGVVGILSSLAELSENAPAELDIAATGEGRVGPDAELVALDGSWVGSLVIDSLPTPLGGELSTPEP